jgi:hypothetical protein
MGPDEWIRNLQQQDSIFSQDSLDLAQALMWAWDMFCRVDDRHDIE